MCCYGAVGFDFMGSDDNEGCRKTGIKEDTPHDLSTVCDGVLTVSGSLGGSRIYFYIENRVLWG